MSTMYYDQESQDQLMDRVYLHLRRLGSGLLQKQQIGNREGTLDLLGSAYLRLAGPDAVLEDGKPSLAAAAPVIRRVIVEHLRHRNPAEPDRLLSIHDAMCSLASIDERQARIAELRLFGCLSLDETAQALRISSRTVRRDWMSARTWLASRVSRPELLSCPVEFLDRGVMDKAIGQGA